MGPSGKEAESTLYLKVVEEEVEGGRPGEQQAEEPVSGVWN